MPTKTESPSRRVSVASEERPLARVGSPPIVTDTSRLSRDTKDLTNLVHWMSHHDVRIFVVDQDASQVPETCPLMHKQAELDWAIAPTAATDCC